MRQIVLDTETTGLLVEEHHRIIEIACVELVNRKLTGKTFHYYLNPEREIDAEAQAIHGITQQFLQDKPMFRTVAAELIEFIKGSELIIHNAPFDVGFMNNELSKTGKTWKLLDRYCKITDTLMLARQLHVGQRNSLDALCKRYGIDNSGRQLHGALLDAHLLAEVYLAMTGGQGSLFDLPDTQDFADHQTDQVMTQVPVSSSTALKVIFADAEELALHVDYLQMLDQQGKCVWSKD